MSHGRGTTSIEHLLAEQLAYYRSAAKEYDHLAISAPGAPEAQAAIDAFQPTGDVLEPACGHRATDPPVTY